MYLQCKLLSIIYNCCIKGTSQSRSCIVEYRHTATPQSKNIFGTLLFVWYCFSILFLEVWRNFLVHCNLWFYLSGYHSCLVVQIRYVHTLCVICLVICTAFFNFLNKYSCSLFAVHILGSGNLLYHPCVVTLIWPWTGISASVCTCFVVRSNSATVFPFWCSLVFQIVTVYSSTCCGNIYNQNVKCVIKILMNLCLYIQLLLIVWVKYVRLLLFFIVFLSKNVKGWM